MSAYRTGPALVEAGSSHLLYTIFSFVHCSACHRRSFYDRRCQENGPVRRYTNLFILDCIRYGFKRNPRNPSGASRFRFRQRHAQKISHQTSERFESFGGASGERALPSLRGASSPGRR